MVNEKKIKKAEQVKELIESHSVIGILDMYKMPSSQLQEIRKNLRGSAKMKMTKKSTLKHALDAVEDEKIRKIEEHMPKQPAFLLTDMDPFKIYAMAKNLKFKTYAKEGDTAEEDIWVYAGPTSLMAGPAISEFQEAGVPAGIEAGKIAIKKDKLLVKKGESINGPKANILRKLKIQPISVTLNITAVYEDGVVYTEDSLGMVLEIPKMIPQAFNSALNLSINIIYPTKENIEYLLSKASMEAKAINNLLGTSKDKKEEPEKEETATQEKPEESSEDEGEKTEETPSEEQETDKKKENEEV